MDFAHVQKLTAIHGTPTLFLSESRLRESFRELQSALPGVSLYYAVKSNAESEIVSILKSEGSLFDICTNGEIDIIKNAGVVHRSVSIRIPSNGKVTCGMRLTLALPSSWRTMKMSSGNSCPTRIKRRCLYG